MLSNKELIWESRYRSDSIRVVKVFFSKQKGSVLRNIKKFLHLFFIADHTAYILNPGRQILKSPFAVIIGKHQAQLCMGTQRNKTQCFEESSQSSIPKGKKNSLIHAVSVTSHSRSNGPPEFFVQILKKTSQTKLFWTQQNCFTEFSIFVQICTTFCLSENSSRVLSVTSATYQIWSA